MPDSLSLAQARRVALAAQGFGRARPASVGTRQLTSLMTRLGVLQLDSVNVLERSHYLPVFARLGAYDKAMLDRLSFAPRARYREYWAHEAALVNVDDLPLFRWRMHDFRARFATRDDGWTTATPAMLERVRAELAARGPLAASEFTRDAPRPRGTWWDWDDIKRALERAFRLGDVVSAGRRRFERVYALPEQVLPREVLEREVPRDDAIHRLMSHALAAHGVGTLGDLADYFRLPRSDARTALARLVDEGVAHPVSVEGWTSRAFLHRDARLPRRVEATALLSPFDPVVWERDRALRLFDFHYRIEIYTPAAKRVFGYYSLPVLVDDRLVGRVDLKNDRQARVLRVQSAWIEPWVDDARGAAGGVGQVAERVASELRAMAAWQGCERVEVVGRGTLAPALAAVLGAARHASPGE